MSRQTATALASALLAVLLTGCGGGDGASVGSDYCEAVRDHQTELTDIAASTEPGTVFEALDAYRELADKAPPDLGDEWSQVILRIEALQATLEDADVDPSTYDPKTTLKNLPADQRSAISGAARDLGDQATIAAMAGIEQQSLDVCHTPLSQ